MAKKLKVLPEFWFLDCLSWNQIWCTAIHFLPSPKTTCPILLCIIFLPNLIEHYFGHPLKSLNEILWCNHSNESYRTLLIQSLDELANLLLICYVYQKLNLICNIYLVLFKHFIFNNNYGSGESKFYFFPSETWVTKFKYLLKYSTCIQVTQTMYTK